MLLELAERMLNRNIASSTPARRLAELLDDKSLAVDVDGASLRVVCSIRAAQLELALDAEREADVTIKARPLDLLTLAGADGLSGLKRTGAEIRGELQVAEAFGELLRFARPDLEEELARWIGDMPAHQLAQTLCSIDAWSRRSATSVETSLAEYLHDEARVLPTTADVDQFNRDVEDLRDDVARAELRLGRLQAKLAEATG
jgi:ubiquinone biosynthesis protein UbiJ